MNKLNQVFGAVTKAYPSANDTKKKRICSLVLELESEIKGRGGQILELKDGTTSLHKPSGSEIIKETHKCPKTAKEHAQRAAIIQRDLP